MPLPTIKESDYRLPTSKEMKRWTGTPTSQLANPDRSYGNPGHKPSGTHTSGPKGVPNQGS